VLCSAISLGSWEAQYVSRPMDVEPTVVSIITEMTKIPAALKSWRTAVIDLINDNRVFNCDPEDGKRWSPIVKVLYNSDKTAFTELLGSYHIIRFNF
jgi:hypothetical protein